MGKRRIKFSESTLTETSKLITEDMLYGDTSQVVIACTKQTYYNLKDAKDAALMARMRSEDNIYPYVCTLCNEYHIGHQFS